MPPDAPPAVAITAHAKINLYLHVTGRRTGEQGGYHTLDSLIAFAGTGDRLTITASDDLAFTVTGPRADQVPMGDDNLVLKAAHALAEHAGVAAGAAITLEKHLPAASGIGGGSADAAAALTGLARLWRLNPDEDELRRLGLSLGADVPVCLFARPAFVAGIGEVITPTPTLPAAWLVLANPGVAVPTAKVFAARTGAFSAPMPFTDAPQDAAALAALLKERRNDLTEAACALAPPIRDTLAALEDSPDALLVRLSGSGATCFALFAEEPQAWAAAAALKRAHPGWWVEAAPLLV